MRITKPPQHPLSCSMCESCSFLQKLLSRVYCVLLKTSCTEFSHGHSLSAISYRLPCSNHPSPSLHLLTTIPSQPLTTTIDNVDFSKARVPGSSRDISQIPAEQDTAHHNARRAHVPRRVQMHRQCRSTNSSNTALPALQSRVKPPHSLNTILSPPQSFHPSTKQALRHPSRQELNIILSHTYEYRTPPPPKATSPCPQKITLDLQSRYIGLVVVPGTEVVKIEVEEFASQMRNAGGISAWGRGWDSIEVEV